MGSSVSVQTVVNDITNEMRTELEMSASASATANCIMKIESVNIGVAQNCNIKFGNFCSAKAEASIDASIDATMKVVNNLAVEQKAAAAKYFTMSVGVQTNVTDMDNDMRTYLTQTCKSEAYLNNMIDIGSFNIGQCLSDTTISIEVLNVGQASANCVIETVLNVAMEATNNITQGQEHGTNWGDIIWIVVAGLAIVAVAFILYLVFKHVLISSQEKADIELAKQGAWSAQIKSLTAKRNYD